MLRAGQLQQRPVAREKPIDAGPLRKLEEHLIVGIAAAGQLPCPRRERRADRCGAQRDRNRAFAIHAARGRDALAVELQRRISEHALELGARRIVDDRPDPAVAPRGIEPPQPRIGEDDERDGDIRVEDRERRQLKSWSDGALNESRNRKFIGTLRLMFFGGIGDWNHFL